MNTTTESVIGRLEIRVIAVLTILLALGGHCVALTKPESILPGRIKLWENESIADGLASCPRDTTQTCIIDLAPGIIKGNIRISRPNTWILGAGMGTYHSTTTSTGDYIAPIGAGGAEATVIQCGIGFAYEGGATLQNIKVENLSVDQGDANVSAGICPEQDALYFYSYYSQTVMPPVTNVTVSNVSVLGRNSASPFHSFRVENFIHFTGHNIKALFATHGPVLKAGTDGHLDTIWSAGHASDCVVFKAGTATVVSTNLSNSTLNNLYCTYAQPSDTRGAEFDAQNGVISNIQWTGIALNGTTRGLDYEGDGGLIEETEVYDVQAVSSADSSSSNNRLGINLVGNLTANVITGFYGFGWDLCIAGEAPPLIENLVLDDATCHNTWGIDVVTGGTGTVSLTDSTIIHDAAISQPTVTVIEKGGIVPAGPCGSFTPGAGLWYVPLLKFEGGGCTVEPTGFLTVSGNSVNSCTVATAGSGCSSSPAANVTPSWQTAVGYSFQARNVNLEVFNLNSNVPILAQGLTVTFDPPQN